MKQVMSSGRTSRSASEAVNRLNCDTLGVVEQKGTRGNDDAIVISMGNRLNQLVACVEAKKSEKYNDTRGLIQEGY